MVKRAWQSADDFETELLPKMDRRRVRRNDEIKLHGAKTHSARLIQTMLGHRTADPLPARTPCNHEGCIGDMRAAAGLVGPQNVRPGNAPILLARCSGRRCRPRDRYRPPRRSLEKYSRPRRDPLRLLRGFSLLIINCKPNRECLEFRVYAARTSARTPLKAELQASTIAVPNKARATQQARRVSVLRATAPAQLGQNPGSHAARSHSIL